MSPSSSGDSSFAVYLDIFAANFKLFSSLLEFSNSPPVPCEMNTVSCQEYCSGKPWSRKTNSALTPSTQPAVPNSYVTFLPKLTAASQLEKELKKQHLLFCFLFKSYLSRTSKSCRHEHQFAPITSFGLTLANPEK